MEEKEILSFACDRLRDFFKRDDIMLGYGDHGRYVNLGFKRGDKVTWCSVFSNHDRIEISGMKTACEIYGMAFKRIKGWLDAGWDGQSFLDTLDNPVPKTVTGVSDDK